MVQRRFNLNSTKSIYVSTIFKSPFLRTLHAGIHFPEIVDTGHSLSSRKNEILVRLTQKMSHLSLKGEVDHARKIFDEMRVRDLVSWNVMIRCYAENGMVENARELFDAMPERSSFSWNTMITACMLAERIYMALKLFVVMPDKDVVSWTAVITGLCRSSLVDDAWRLFKQMPDAHSVSWSCIVSGFQQNGFANESLMVFKEMLLVGIHPTPHLFSSALSACADLAMVSMSEQIYCQLLRRGFHGNTNVGNSAISMFVKVGSIHHARAVFLDLDKPDLVSWNAMITGFSQHGYGIEAMMAFHQMQKAQFYPDSITYMGVLHGCSHCGFVEEGRQYFLSMKMDSGIFPGPEHFSTMVDMYARAGKLKEAYTVIMELPFEPTSIFWRALLNGCRIWGDFKLGVFAAEQILKLERFNSSACSMVINIMALAGKWKEVATMRQLMKETEVKKELGCSWINMRGINHLFTTGDKAHPKGDQIFKIVELLAYDGAREHSETRGFLDIEIC
ncbi:pentatricopeptide repeat-containing protein At2g13600-like [Primulina eburnea]|uniref:pentatricopeptide repeat-containing protein At2g13600-like n=1 Tax=Primulina eburnea TaxID=1245227 RepID=UPI003C6C1B9C